MIKATYSKTFILTGFYNETFYKILTGMHVDLTGTFSQTLQGVIV